MSRAAQSGAVSENAGAWKATDTQGRVGPFQGTCAFTGPVGGGSAGIATV